MMNILLKNQWKIFKNTIRTQLIQNTIGFGVALLVIAFFMFIFGKLIWAISGEVSPVIFESLFSFWLLAVIGMIVLMGTPQVFKNLYSGSDLEMLFTMPIPTRNIFWVKYIQGYFGTPLFIFIVSTVPVVVYGLGIRASFLYFIVALIALFAATIIGLSLAFLLNLVLIQVVPPGRANEFMAVMSFLSGMIVYLIIMLPNMTSDVSFADRLLAGLPVFPKWFPVGWGSSATASAIDGSLAAFIPLGMFILLAIIMAIVATMIVEKGFRTGWIRLSERSTKKYTRKKKRGKFITKINHPIIAVGKKEWLTIKRDLREWLTLMPIIFFLIFGLIGFLSGGGNIDDIRGYGDISWPIVQGILLFLYALTNGMIAASSIGREGSNLWIVQVMPLSGTQFVYGKFWISWLLPFIVVSLIEVIAFFFLGWTIWQLVIGIFVKGIITMAMSAIGLWIGTLGAKYNPANPQQRLTFFASIALFILSYIYLLIVMVPVGYLMLPQMVLDELPQNLNHGIPGFFGLVVTLLLSVLLLKVNYPILVYTVGIPVLALFSIGLTYLFLLLSAHRVDQGLKIDMVSESSSRSLRGRRKGKSGSLY